MIGYGLLHKRNMAKEVCMCAPVWLGAYHVHVGEAMQAETTAIEVAGKCGIVGLATGEVVVLNLMDGSLIGSLGDLCGKAAAISSFVFSRSLSRHSAKTSL